MINAVFVDIDNTLLSFDEYVKYALRTGFDKYGLMEYSEDVYETFEEINLGFWHRLEQGEITFEDIVRDRFNAVFAALGVTFDGPTFETYFRECLNESAIPEPGAHKFLEYLAGKYEIYGASNGPFFQQINRLKIGNMYSYFKDVYVSGELGVSKPSRKFFEICLERVNEKRDHKILPEEILMVGDSLTSDIRGGMDFGMKTCWYDPKKKPVPEDMEIDMVIHELKEIEAYL